MTSGKKLFIKKSFDSVRIDNQLDILITSLSFKLEKSYTNSKMIKLSFESKLKYLFIGL